jgi:hypothetical protein
MFTVAWSDDALETLAAIYVTLDLRQQDRVAAAVAALNTRLAHAPFDEGESRTGPSRITFIDRLAVTFWVNEPGRSVRVTALAPFGL